MRVSSCGKNKICVTMAFDSSDSSEYRDCVTKKRGGVGGPAQLSLNSK